MWLIRGLAALVALALGLVGIPFALALLGGNPLPERLSWSGLAQALLRPDDGTILLGLVAVAGWVAWLVFAVSVVSELVALLSGQRVRIPLPGLAGPRRLAAGLLLTVLAMAAAPANSAQEAPTLSPAAGTSTSARAAEVVRTIPASTSNPATSWPATSGPTATGPTTSGPATSGPATSGHTTSGPSGDPGSSVGPVAARHLASPGAVAVGSGERAVTHEVQRGDDLWTLAEHYYGQGREWRQIAAANPRLLTGGPDRLQPGWLLTIPGATPPAAQPGPTMVVRGGDTLSSLAQTAYGDSSRWSEIYAANRSSIEDPDEIRVGTRLVVPVDRGADATPDRTQDGETKRSAGTDSTDEQRQGEAKRQAAAKRQGEAAERQAEVRRKAEPPGPAESTRPSDPGNGQAPGPTSSRVPAPPESTLRPTTSQGPAEPMPTRGPPESAPTGSVSGSEPTRNQGSLAPPAANQPGELLVDVGLGLGAIGGVLAAAVLAGLARRRTGQLQARPVGRRILHAPAPAQRLETALGHRQEPFTLDTLDLVLRAVSAHCRSTAAELPPLALATVGPEQIELLLSEPTGGAPVGFTVSGRSWLLDHGDARYLASLPGVADAPRPYPALVTLGRDATGAQVLADLELMGLLALRSADPQPAVAMLAALAAELSFSPWADEMILTLVGDADGLPQALARPNVNRTDDLDELLDRLESRADVQHEQQGAGARRARTEPDLAEAWAPEIVLVQVVTSPEQERRLLALVSASSRTTVAAVVAAPLAAAPWALELGSGTTPSSADPTAVLRPVGLELVPSLLVPTAAESVVALVAATGTERTTPAPWWDHTVDPPPAVPPDHAPNGRGGLVRWGSRGDDTGEQGIMRQSEGPEGADVHHPILLLLGPVLLVGARGVDPPRASKQCLEYCCWLLEHPGTTAQAMASALVVAEGTRRSNMSRLRSWLGADPEGQPYLPDAYTGRIVLHPSVSSDWQRLQILTAAGVNRTSTNGLRAALELVRGAPLADAAPGQWHWAEELRTDMISVVRDIGVEVSTRALDDHDIDLARWAAARALVAAPGDELLMAARIRTEHQAGNRAETERLTLQLAGHARSLGVDLESTTVVLLQEVMEGRVRARLA